jgi:signal transduction histidine kinase
VLRDRLPRDARLNVDRMLMKRALLNIIENAIHAQKDAGKDVPVTFWVTVSRRYLHFHIEDHGTGVPDPELIFEPYYTTKPSGTGLGLPLAKKIILDHEGDITVRGAGGDGGTLVTVQLPRVEG